MKEGSYGIVKKNEDGLIGTLLTLLLIGSCTLIIFAGIMAQSLTEETIILRTEYGYNWSENVIRSVIASAQNPWVMACYEIREGEKTSNGALIAGIDTLIVRVQGPRKEVEAVCEILESCLR